MTRSAGESAVQLTNFASMSCVEQCAALLNAYNIAVTGKRRIRVIYDNYQVEYAPNETAALLNFYRTLRSQCPAAQACLPDLSPGKRATRGPAIRGVL